LCKKANFITTFFCLIFSFPFALISFHPSSLTTFVSLYLSSFSLLLSAIYHRLTHQQQQLLLPRFFLSLFLQYQQAGQAAVAVAVAATAGSDPSALQSNNL